MKLVATNWLAIIVISGSALLMPSVVTAQSQTTQQAMYSSPDEAVQALKAACEAKDRDAVQKVFGPALNELCSGDEVQDKADFEQFAKHLAEQHKIVPDGEDRATLEVGVAGHPFAIPLVRKNGKWFFDTAAGKEEVLNRRVGDNELGAIRVCRGYVVAQLEYFSQDRDGDDVLEYAQNFASSPGKHDGLYWETKPEEPLSPLGPAVAQARAEGYKKDDAQPNKPQPYHGYVYRILTGQAGKSAGGAFDYVINGNMVAGFAMVAYPVQWQDSGVMTFLVNSNGKVYQKDLGEKTPEIAGAMKAYEIDSTWTLVQD